MLDSLAAADREVAQELDRLACSATPISSGTVAALERLLLTVRPAAAIRTALAAVDRRILAAAIGLRRDRRDAAGVPGLGSR
jgi:hypothetical protein